MPAFTYVLRKLADFIFLNSPCDKVKNREGRLRSAAFSEYFLGLVLFLTVPEMGIPAVLVMTEKRKSQKLKIGIPDSSSPVIAVGLEACQVGWAWKIAGVAEDEDLLGFPHLQNTTDSTSLYP